MKNFLLILLGLAIGSLVTYFMTTKECDSFLQDTKRIEEVEKLYQEMESSGFVKGANHIPWDDAKALVQNFKNSPHTLRGIASKTGSNCQPPKLRSWFIERDIIEDYLRARQVGGTNVTPSGLRIYPVYKSAIDCNNNPYLYTSIVVVATQKDGAGEHHNLKGAASRPNTALDFVEPCPDNCPTVITDDLW